MSLLQFIIVCLFLRLVFVVNPNSYKRLEDLKESVDTAGYWTYVIVGSIYAITILIWGASIILPHLNLLLNKL